MFPSMITKTQGEFDRVIKVLLDLVASADQREIFHGNIGFQEDTSHFNFIVNPAGGGTINPTFHYPLRAESSASRRPEPIIPLFHYSNCERSELTGKYRNFHFGDMDEHGLPGY